MVDELRSTYLACSFVGSHRAPLKDLLRLVYASFRVEILIYEDMDLIQRL